MNFIDALKIHAICIDNSLSESDARILFYIHCKISEKGINFFFESTIEREYDKSAISIMLGKDIKLSDNAEIQHFFESISEKIKQLDTNLREHSGLENRVISELSERLKLYTDENFCKKMVFIYLNLIVPKLNDYSNDRSMNIWKEYGEKQKKLNDELLNSLNS